jgi:hypothetical protein
MMSPGISWERFKTRLEGDRLGILPFEGWAYGIRRKLKLLGWSHPNRLSIN